MEEVKYTESDIYVRDMLLIQFMKEYQINHDIDTIEVAYEDWIEWLKEMEERHAERSKI